MYQYDQRPNTQLDEESQEILRNLRELEYAIFVGRNNCGKSFLLKSLTQQWGQSASYLGPARYQNFNLLGYYTPNRNRKDERWRQFTHMWQQQQQNIDNSPVNLQDAIAELSDSQRASLIEIVDLLLGVKLEIRQTVEGNSMSQRYISCDGHNVSYTSSGFRLIATLVTSLLDTEYDTFLIDEPELGISPEAQSILADFLFDRQHRTKYFPHIRTLVFATHSTVFLDRHRVSNNHVVNKRADIISVRSVASQCEFNRVHFFLLGNRFETLYLPSVIIIVEGKTDHRFIERVCTVRFPNAQISIVSANSDARVKEVLGVARGLLADIQRSPYRDRIFVVLDAVHSVGLPAQLVQMGLQPENIITWPENGIEYYYPPSVMDKIYGAGGNLLIEGDRVSRNSLTYSKNELVERVCAFTEESTTLSPQFEALFLSKVAERIG